MKTPHEEGPIGRDIAATDLRIDQLIHDLNAMTKKDIAIIKDATAGR